MHLFMFLLHLFLHFAVLVEYFFSFIQFCAEHMQEWDQVNELGGALKGKFMSCDFGL